MKRDEPGLFGLQIFLASLSMLFAAALVAYLIVRTRAEVWQPAASAGLPHGLWFSTLLLAACSFAAQRALREIRGGRAPHAARDLTLMWVPAWGFVASQAWSWWSFRSTVPIGEHSLYGFTFLNRSMNSVK